MWLYYSTVVYELLTFCLRNINLNDLQKKILEIKTQNRQPLAAGPMLILYVITFRGGESGVGEPQTGVGAIR